MKDLNLLYPGDLQVLSTKAQLAKAVHEVLITMPKGQLGVVVASIYPSSFEWLTDVISTNYKTEYLETAPFTLAPGEESKDKPKYIPDPGSSGVVRKYFASMPAPGTSIVYGWSDNLLDIVKRSPVRLIVYVDYSIETRNVLLDRISKIDSEIYDKFKILMGSSKLTTSEFDKLKSRRFANIHLAGEGAPKYVIYSPVDSSIPARRVIKDKGVKDVER